MRRRRKRGAILDGESERESERLNVGGLCLYKMLG